MKSHKETLNNSCYITNDGIEDVNDSINSVLEAMELAAAQAFIAANIIKNKMEWKYETFEDYLKKLDEE